MPLWLCQKGAGGNAPTIVRVKAAIICPANPIQITWRDRVYPYTSVKISLKIKAIGKSIIPPGKLKGPMEKIFDAEIVETTRIRVNKAVNMLNSLKFPPVGSEEY